MHRNVSIALIIVILAILAASVFVLSKYATKLSFKLAASTTINANQGPHAYAQEFCLNAVTNLTAMQFALDSGVNCFRTDISLNKSEMDYVSNISKSGGSFLGILDYETVGAHPSRNGCTGNCNWTLNDWNSSVENAVLDYPEIHTWEIWNEPLVSQFMDGYENGSAFNYYTMIKSAYIIIKKNDPNSTVVCFGGPQMYPFNYVEVEYPFYSKVWSYGASKYCDAVSLHAYTGQYYNFSQRITASATLYEEYNYTLNLYENLTGKPVWITETGIPSNNWTSGVDLSDQRQASFLKQDFSFFSNYSFVKRVYWFHLAGPAGGADYGLLNPETLKPKQSWYSFLYFLHNSTLR